MHLKQYQTETLATLSQFLRDSKIYGISHAYTAHAVDNPNNPYAGTEYKPLDGTPDAPSVCIRIPTGGGKTILASHAVKIASDYTERDFPVVVWLVPSDTIRQQTVNALKNPSHPYRTAINEQFGGTDSVKVLDIAEYPNIRPTDLCDHLAIIVGTVQTLLINDTNKRRVYAHHEALEPHFAQITPTEKMETADNGRVKYSFANLMHHHRPIMILDEGHRFTTRLSGDMIARLNPSLVLEFTATPKGKQNVLVSVPATTLRDAEMIKLPIQLSQHTDWQGAVDGAIQKRNQLAETCHKNGEKIRPIVLFQAENKDKTVNVQHLKTHLIEELGIPPEKIAIATGEQRELDKINVMEDNCPIEYIRGWHR